jgi:DNA-binding transcriptional LysR family regulator
MDVYRLELLRELAERGSVTAVAAATNRTASAVSQQLKVLEREAGIALTEKAGRGIRLTGAGRMLAQTATDVAVALERAEAAWESFKRAPAGEVTLTTFPTAGQMLLPGVLAAAARVPGLTVLCSDQDPLLPDFADLVSDFDVVLADAPRVLPVWRQRGLAIVPLLVEPLDIAMAESHPLAAKAALSPRDVRGATWIGGQPGSAYDEVLEQIEQASGETADIRQHFRDNGIVEAVVASSDALAILPRFTTRDHENGLTTRSITGIPTQRQIAALMRPDRAERPSVRRVIEILRAEADRVVALHAAPLLP